MKIVLSTIILILTSLTYAEAEISINSLSYKIERHELRFHLTEKFFPDQVVTSLSDLSLCQLDNSDPGRCSISFSVAVVGPNMRRLGDLICRSVLKDKYEGTPIVTLAPNYIKDIWVYTAIDDKMQTFLTNYFSEGRIVKQIDCRNKN